MGHSRPNTATEQSALHIGAEAAVLHALLIDPLTGIYLNARIHDGYQTDPPVQQLCGKFLQVWKFFGVYREIPITVHIIDIHADIIQGNAGILVAFHDLTEILFALIAIAALSVAEGPARRQIGRTYRCQELPDCLISCRGLHLINCHILGTGHPDLSGFPVIDLKNRSCRRIKKDAESPLFQNQQIVRGIQRRIIIAVICRVCIEADVSAAALIHSTGGLTQTVHHLIRFQRADKAKLIFLFFCREIPKCFLLLYRLHHCFRHKRCPK